MWRVLFIAVLILPSLTHAASVPRDRNTGLYQGKYLHVQSIHIAAHEEVLIEAGSHLEFVSGAGIFGQGKLEIRGTEQSPVVLTGDYWRGIDFEGSVVLEHVRVLGATGYFSFSGEQTELRHVTFDDIPDSRVFFWPKNTSGVVLESLVVRWHTIPSNKGKAGVFIKGPAAEVVIRNLTLPRSVELPASPLVEVTNGYRGLHVIGAKTLDGCFLGNPELQLLQYARYRIQPSCTPQQPSLLFVPGFGASLNFNQLTNPRPGNPVLEGWSLVPFITADYKAFLKSAESRGVKAGTAYYDWRLNPDEAAEQYLIPALDAIKQRDNVSKVFLVAHSYGGLVARAYVQSTKYRGDVAGLVLVGVPNLGSVKAYAPWQAAEFPEDWQVLSHLSRLYNYLDPGVKSELQALRTYIPSGRSLQPTGAVLYRSRESDPDALFYLPNTFLPNLNSGEILLKRVPLIFTVTGDELTPTTLHVGERRARAQYWMDGEQFGIASRTLGDGTVTQESAALPLVSKLAVPGSHMQLMQSAAEQVIGQLYPMAKRTTSPPLSGASRETRRILWFAFDCPITVEMSTPSGLVLRSQDTSEQVFANADAIWMLLEEESGDYEIKIEALETTKVRWWQGLGSIHQYELKKGEKRTTRYKVASSPPPQISQPLILSHKDLPEESPPTLSFERVFLPWSNVQFRSFGIPEFESPERMLAAVQQSQEPTAGNSPGKARLILFAPLILLLRKRARSESHSHHPP